MRLSRPCYDKPWRCPGWAGGGMRYAKTKRCEGGHTTGWHGGRWQHFAFHHCDTCDVVTLPYVARWLSPVFAIRTLKWWLP